MKHAFKATSMLALIGILPLACVSFAQPASRRPNVLLIITDDQGYGDPGLHGNEQISTPTLDQLGRESIRFDRFFASPLCAPTRASLLTGRYSLRAGVSGVAEGQETMRAEALTIAELKAGVLTLPQGRAKLTLRALTKPGDVVMDLKSVVLKQID